MVQPECLKTSECPGGVCVNGKCKEENISLHSRCTADPNCSGYDRPNPNYSISCENGYCLRSDYKNPMDKPNGKCSRDLDCKNKDQFCYNRKCIDYRTNTTDFCNDKDKRCSEELACYGDRCRERCWAERDGEEGGCEESGKVCRKVTKFSYFNVCLPKGMAIAKQNVTQPSTQPKTTTPDTTPKPTTPKPTPKKTDGEMGSKAIWLVGGFSGIIIIALIAIICLVLIKRRPR